MAYIAFSKATHIHTHTCKHSFLFHDQDNLQNSAVSPLLLNAFLCFSKHNSSTNYICIPFTMQPAPFTNGHKNVQRTKSLRRTDVTDLRHLVTNATTKSVSEKFWLGLRLGQSFLVQQARKMLANRQIIRATSEPPMF